MQKVYYQCLKIVLLSPAFHLSGSLLTFHITVPSLLHCQRLLYTVQNSIFNNSNVFYYKSQVDHHKLDDTFIKYYLNE